MGNDIEIKIDIERILGYLYSDKISSKYIRFLSEYIDLLNTNELNVFKIIADDLKYKKKYYGMKKYKIGDNSIKLSLKIFNQTGIKTFPYIERIACKGWSISDGSFAWMMYKLENYPGDTLNSDIRVRICLRKDVVLENSLFNRFDFISLK
jgi:hypothetical protein